MTMTARHANNSNSNANANASISAPCALLQLSQLGSLKRELIGGKEDRWEHTCTLV